MILVVEPNDVLMFRESKPFGVGYHLARTTLPLPQTIAGAIRSAIYLSNDPDAVKDIIGYGEEDPGFEILGTFFYRKRDGRIEILSKCPRNISSDLRKVKPHKIDQMGVTIFRGEDIHFNSFDGFLSFDGLVEYLRGSEVDKANFIHKEEIFTIERRVGIALTESRVTRGKHLYQTEMLRLQNNCGLLVWIKDEHTSPDSSAISRLVSNPVILRLGGEGKFVVLKKLHPEPEFFTALSENWESIKKSIDKNGRLKLYLATPAVFENKLEKYTSKLDESILEKYGIKKIENVVSLIGKPISFSGWDYVAKKPKPTRYAVPAGSVYFVEFEGKLDLDRPYLKFGKLTRLGYGLCFVGVW